MKAKLDHSPLSLLLPMLVGLLLMTGACQKQELSTIYGDYTGVASDGRDVSFTIAGDPEANSVILDDLWDFTRPVVTLEGSISQNEVMFEPHECFDCKGLSSPGGHLRYYTITVAAHGTYFPKNDSLHIYLDFDRSGDLGSDSFHGQLFMTKVN